MVGAFVGEELRAKQTVILANGRSYLTINVNLGGTEKVGYRIWDAKSGKEYGVSQQMQLEIGETYGSAETLVKLDGLEDMAKGVIIVDISKVPFGFSFQTEQGKSYTVQSTLNLSKWNPVREFQGTGETVKFIEVRRIYFPQQYYRVRVE